MVAGTTDNNGRTVIPVENGVSPEAAEVALADATEVLALTREAAVRIGHALRNLRTLELSGVLSSEQLAKIRVLRLGFHQALQEIPKKTEPVGYPGQQTWDQE